MKAEEKVFLRFLEGPDKHFVIPVFQRNYDWKKEHCEQLFNDIIDIVKNNFRTHFLGSIVSVYNDDGFGQEYLIIDGQQRITTLSLLLLAIYNLLVSKQIYSDNIIKEKIKDEYLVNKYASKDYKIKLKSVKEDQKYFSQLINREDIENTNSSNIVLNYNFFVDRLKNLESFDIDEIYIALSKLLIVAIELKRGEDDPQLIFESLNSTGLNLTQADLVRNFILMREKKENQIRFFEQYWQKIEKNTDFHVSEYIRDYLTYKENIIPNKDKVYFSFKRYVFKNNFDEKIESLLEDLLVFSTYYKKIIFSKDDDKEISKCLKYINDIGISVCYPFLLEVYDDYAKGLIVKKDLLEILEIIKSFAFRRLICDVPTNALNKIFMTLGRNIKKHDVFEENYVEILKYLLINKKDSQRFPNDQEFSEKIVIKDIYNLKGKNKIHLLESIENYNNKERIDLEKLINDGEINIEHIMPQNLTPRWKKILGDNWKDIYDKYLHTLGNITLTAYNAKMSNKTFIEKRDMENGFKSSKLFLNQSLKNLDYWNEENIEKRAGDLKNISLKVWKNITTSYTQTKKQENIYSLSDDHDFTNEKIGAFIFLNERYEVKSWKDFYEKVSRLLYDLDPNIFISFLNDEDFKGKTRVYIASNESELYKPIQVSDNLFLESNLSAESILVLIRKLLRKYEFAEEDLYLLLESEESFDSYD
jgi:Uncharacterized conserved protein